MSDFIDFFVKSDIITNYEKGGFFMGENKPIIPNAKIQTAY